MKLLSLLLGLTIIIVPFIYINDSTNSVYIKEFAFSFLNLISFFTYFITSQNNRDNKICFPKEYKIFFIFIVYCCIIGLYHSIEQKSIFEIGILLNLLLFLFLMIQIKKNDSGKVILAISIFISMVLQVIVGIFQIYDIGFTSIADEGFIPGTIGNPNFFAMFLIMCLLMFVALTVNLNSIISHKIRLLIYILLILILCGTVYFILIPSEPLGILFSIIISILLSFTFFLYSSKKRLLKITGIFILIFTILLSILIYNNYQNKLSDRNYLNRIGLNILSKNVIIGNGHDFMDRLFMQEQSEYRKDKPIENVSFSSTDHIENGYIEMLCKYGIISLILFLIFILYLAVLVKNRFNYRNNITEIIPEVILLITVNIFLIGNLYTFYLQNIPTSFLFIVTIGILIINLDNNSEPMTKIQYNKIYSKAIFAICFIVCGIILFNNLQILFGDICLSKAIKYSDMTSFYHRTHKKSTMEEYNTEAKKYFEEANNYSCDIGKVLFSEGMHYLNINEYDRSLEKFETSKKYINQLSIILNIGNCYLYKEDYEKAITTFTKGIEINPLDSRFFLRLALCYFGLYEKSSQDNIENAAKYYELVKQNLNKGEELNPNSELIKDMKKELLKNNG